jgi:DNA-binding response OmpR family regulator
VNHKDHRNVGALLAVDSTELQASLIEAFDAAGIPRPQIAVNAGQLRDVLAGANLDLIIMSSVIGTDYVAPMIIEVRRGKLGPHPFPIIVVLVHDADQAAMRQVSNCGPDDIVALPCAPQDLLDRINVFLSGARRPLVVNDGYAGPERRERERSNP